jgi:hypothetical protein
MQREYTPMNAAELMDRVIDIYKKSFWTQIGFAAVVAVVVLAATSLLMMAFLMIAVFALGVGVTMGDTATGIGIAFIIAMGLLLFPAFFFLQAFSSSGHILLSRQAFYGYKPRFKDMGIFKVIMRVFTSILAKALVYLPFVLVGIGVVFVYAVMVEGFSMMDNVPVISIIGFVVIALLLGAGFVLIQNVFSLSVAVATFERRYFFDSLKRSWELIKPNFWKILAIRVIWVFVIATIAGSTQGIYLLFTFLMEFFAGAVPALAMIGVFVMLASSITDMITSIIMAPLDGILHALLYFNQRMKTEGFDIELRLGKLEQQARHEF